ncbi:unnamed protein product [Calypogeia fissa]
MVWKNPYLDAVLVPAGQILMVAYHLRLIYRVRNDPLNTVIGVNQVNRRAWVNFIMQDGKGNGVLGVQTIRNSIMASTLLASTAITLSSLIGALVTGNSSGKASNLIVGSHDNTILQVKYLSLLICFFLAFVCHVQAIRYSSHVSFLISIPMGDNAPGLSPEYVNRLLHRSTNFFSLGLRAYYFSFPLLLWLFGPIPQFACALVMVLFLNIVDTAKEFKLTLSTVEEAKIYLSHASEKSDGAVV